MFDSLNLSGVLMYLAECFPVTFNLMHSYFKVDDMTLCSVYIRHAFFCVFRFESKLEGYFQAKHQLLQTLFSL